MPPAGYSKTPLAKKLGLKSGFIIRLINAPVHYSSLFTDMPADIEISGNAKEKKHFIHFFTKDAAELNELLPQLKNELVPNGIIWVSWPKKSAKTATDVTENLIRDIGLQSGLIDIKVCAVDENWSALKFVIPVKDR